MNKPEEVSPNPIQARVNELLYIHCPDFGESKVGTTNESELRLLHPDLPDNIDHYDLRYAFHPEDRPKTSRLGSVVLWALDGFHTDKRPEISVSPKFTKLYRRMAGTPWGESAWVYLDISESRYDGTLTIGGVDYVFEDSQPIIRAYSAWLDSEGRGPEHKIAYTYIPHLDHIFTDSPQAEVDPSVHYVDRNAEPKDNLMSIIDAASKIPVRGA